MQKFKKSSDRMIEIQNKLEQAQKIHDNTKVQALQQDYDNEKKNEIILHSMSRNLIDKFGSIQIKVQDLKEDFSFIELASKKNIEKINSILQALFNIESMIGEIKSFIESGTDVGASLAAFDLGLINKHINFCLNKIIDEFVIRRYRERLKKSYITKI